MYLQRLSIENFKNCSTGEYEFISGINCIAGDNGVGKTNLLDAIHYLCLCKGFAGQPDADSIAYGADYCTIKGNFMVDGQQEEIFCGIRNDKRKVFKRSQKEYDRLSDHIGMLPLVMITPDDYAIIREGGEERRKFMNTFLSQGNPQYLHDLINYQKTLSQRNKLLKDHVMGPFPMEIAEIYDHQLALTGYRIFNWRSEFTDKIAPLFQRYYQAISGGSEEVSLEYQSQLQNTDYTTLLRDTLSRDRALQYTTTGIHRDNLHMALFGHSIRKTGSQGQQKTYLVALKLAQLELMAQMKGAIPILLLDDIFDKFDQQRVNQIISLVSTNGFGQVFITHTHPEMLRSTFVETTLPFRLFTVKPGKTVIS